MSSRLRMMLFVTCIAILAGCSRERQDWQSAQTADTIEAYGSFIAKHGDSPLATQAETRIRQLGEERDWQQAATLDTLEAYQAYLRQHPESKWADEARIRVENFALGGASPGAPSPSAAPPSAAAPPAATVPPVAAPPVAAPRADSSRPAAAPAPSAAPAKPALGTARVASYGIQLGAFSSEANARAQWQRVSARHGAVLAGLTPSIAPVASGSQTLYRLRATTPTESKARNICAALAAQREACIVFLPVEK